MALTIDCASQDEIELDEYIEWVASNVDLCDQASIVESAPKLHALSQNKSLLRNYLNASLRESTNEGVQAENLYTDVTFMLPGTSQQKFFVRANVWKQPMTLGKSTIVENDLCAYFYAHDHNFDFLTAGHFGPGYRTKIYEYDPKKVEGFVGEEVDVRFLEDTTLPTGKVMFYRRCKDIHSQLPPESMSVSLNLMIPTRLQKYSPQYTFDVDRRRIAGYVDGYSSQRVSVLEIAGEIGDEDTADILAQVARTNPCPRARFAAYQAFLKVLPLEIEAIRRSVANDRSAAVRRLVEELPALLRTD